MGVKLGMGEVAPTRFALQYQNKASWSNAFKEPGRAFKGMNSAVRHSVETIRVGTTREES
jgi:hypothetical protein